MGSTGTLGRDERIVDGHVDHGNVAVRLLRSSDMLSLDPAKEVDWETPLDTAYHAAARSGARSSVRRTGRS